MITIDALKIKPDVIAKIDFFYLNQTNSKEPVQTQLMVKEFLQKVLTIKFFK